MTNKPSFDFTDPKIVISEWGGYVPRSSDEFGEQNIITGGVNMALESPVGSTAKTRITSRLGYSRVTSSPISIDKCQGFRIWRKTTDSTYRIMVANGGRLWEATFSDFSDTLSFTDTTKTCSGTAKVEMVQFGDALYIVDGVNRIKQYTGTVWTDLTDGMLTADDPRPSIIIVHANRLWINSTKPGQKNQIFWSKINDGSKWTVNPSAGDDAGTQLFRGFPDEASPITGIGVYVGSFCVHQQGRIFLFITTGSPYNSTGDVTWQVKELIIDRGTVNHRSIADLGEKILYRTTRGINELAGIAALQETTQTLDTINAKPISYDIEPVLFSLSGDYEAAVFYKFYYILNMKTSSSISNDTALVYDTRRNLWYPPWKNFHFNCFQVANINGQEVCYAGSDKNGHIYTLFTSSTDDGEDIEAYFDTAAFDCKQPDHSKTWRRLAFVPYTTTRGIYVSYSVDYGPWVEFGPEFTGASIEVRPLGRFILGMSRLGAGFMSRFVQKFVAIGRRGRHCRIRFSNNNSAGTGGKKPFAIEAMSLTAYMEDQDKREYA